MQDSLPVRGGLSTAEASARLRAEGPNALQEVPGPSFLGRLLRQFQSAIIYLLLLALALDLGAWIYQGARGVPVEALAILSVLVLNAGLGVLQEYRSEHALAELRALGAPQVWALRDGELRHIPTRNLVVGDVIRLEAGDRIPADGRALDAHGLAIDESMLTGESLAQTKRSDDELFSGTLVVRGKTLAEVTRTGPSSAMGRLAATLGGIETLKTPLERRLDALGSKIARYVAALSVVLIAGGLAVEGLSHLETVVMFAVALAVAIVPEGMPAVITLALAIGVQRMARRSALVRRLASVEALGSVTVIASDKTGTLTENKLSVAALEANDESEALKALVLANDAEFGVLAGDPLDVALLEYAGRRGLDSAALREVHRRLDARPFDSEWKFMRVSVDSEQGTVSYVKGAFEVVLGRCRLNAEQRQDWHRRAAIWAARGFKVLGVAFQPGTGDDELTLLGFVTLWDPPRPEAAAAMARARGAGIRVLMITGDHPVTARAIAEQVGISGATVVTDADLEGLSDDHLHEKIAQAQVFARMRPEHKLRIVKVLQARGEIVAMTGDGLNDAPALKRADVGVAMGGGGSDIAREVADIVLLDDNFATIVSAIEEGRVIYENLQKFVRFTFSTNVALTGLVLGGALGSIFLGLRGPGGALLLPLTALQILWINFLGDGPPALALAVDRNAGVLEEPPRPPDAPLLDPPSIRFVLGTGIVQACIGLTMLLLLPALGFGVAETGTAVFLFASVAKLMNVFPARRRAKQEPNRWLLLCVGFGVALQIACLTIPGLRSVLGLVPLSAGSLSVVLGAIATSWMLAELIGKGGWLMHPRLQAR